MPSSATLDSVPTEVVHNIALHLEVDGCLALAQSCHSLRSSCLDALLLRQVIGTQHTLWNFHSLNLLRIARRLNYDIKILQRYKFFALDQDRLGRWDKLAFNETIQHHFGLDLDVWARFAVADLRAFRLCSELNSQVDESGRGKYGFASDASFERTMAYLPHILTLKHSAIHASGLAPALALQVVKAVDHAVDQGGDDGDSAVNAVVSNRLAFAYCATMLSQDTPEAPLLGASTQRAAMNAFFTSRCRDFAKRLQASAPSSPTEVAQPRRQTTRMTQAEAQVIIGAFSSLLRHAFREYRVRRLIGADYYTFILPFALDVPMDHGIKAIEPPLPFVDHDEIPQRSWEDWHADQIDVMTSYEFLSTGRWVGCYSYTYPKVPEIDAPMMDICFDFTTSSAGMSDATAVRATGTDSIGDFILHGFVERTGHVSLSKVYEHGTRWDWNCQMTPFGIGGVWGPPDSDIVNGSVWLWKKEWTERGRGAVCA